MDRSKVSNESREQLTLKSNSNATEQFQRPEPEHATRAFVYVLTLLAAIGGFLFGYDTGVVSGAMILIHDQFNLNNLWHEMIVSATILAAWVFSLCGGFLSDFCGRKPVILMASFVFTVGAVVMGVANDKVTLLVGRIIVGVGIGLVSSTVPMYIAESAPSHMRGFLVTINNVFITGGQFVAGLICGGFSSNKENGWRYMLGLSGVPSLIQFVGFLGMPESPRWLVKKGRLEQATVVLKTMRSASEDVAQEVESIHQSCVETDRERGTSSVLVDIFKTAHVRRALVLGCGMQMFQQLAGINTVMYYSAAIIQMAGISDDSQAIWLAAVTSGVNFFCTFIGLYLVERIGRKPLTMGSLGGTVLSLAVLGAGFQVAALKAPSVTVTEDVSMTSMCTQFRSCAPCTDREDCGFCYNVFGDDQPTNGSCLPIVFENSDLAAFGRCNSTSLPEGTLWAHGYCPSDYAWLPILGLALYLFFFAPGMGPMPWTVNSEIYPLWARGTANSIATSVNWFFNLLVSMTFLTLTESITKYGAFYFYMGLAMLGMVFLFFVQPETKGKSLEEVEGLFARSLCSTKPMPGQEDRTIQPSRDTEINERKFSTNSTKSDSISNGSE